MTLVDVASITDTNLYTSHFANSITAAADLDSETIVSVFVLLTWFVFFAVRTIETRPSYAPKPVSVIDVPAAVQVPDVSGIVPNVE